LRRPVLLALGAAVAGGTLAVALGRRKPEPVVLHPAPPPAVQLRGAEALTAVDPPVVPPAIRLVDADGRAHGLGEFAGKGLVVNLWATWCLPCVAELPDLADLAGRVRAEGVEVLALSSDRGGAPVVEAFFRAHGIEGLPVWLDPDGAAGEAWAVRGIPTTLILDRAGRERARVEGPVDWGAAPVVAAVLKLAGSVSVRG
jgi:thiol-disulfide isomerase/thioredoxin